MEKLDRKRINEIIDKIDDFSEKFPMLKKKEINIKQLSKFWGEKTSTVKAVFRLLEELENYDLDIDDIEELFYEKGKGNKKVILKDKQEIEIENKKTE